MQAFACTRDTVFPGQHVELIQLPVAYPYYYDFIQYEHCNNKNRIPLNSKTAYNTVALRLAGNSETTMQPDIQAPDLPLVNAATNTRGIDGHKTYTGTSAAIKLIDGHE